MGGPGPIPQDRLDELSALASGLCRDARVGLVVGRQWAWDPVRKVIIASRDDLVRRGAGYCAAIVAHEVGHALITRYHLMPSEFVSQAALPQILNALEDPRVESWMGRRYPGARMWLDEVARTEQAPDPDRMPSLMAFLAECARTVSRDGTRNERPAEQLPEAVAGALCATREARFAVRDELLPPWDTLEPEPSRARTRRYSQRVVPALDADHARRIPTAHEQVVRLSALAALERIRSDILPVAADLYRADVEQMRSWLCADDRRRSVARAAIESSDHDRIRAVVRDAMSQPETVSTEGGPLRGLAAEVYEAWLRDQFDRGQGRGRIPPGASPGDAGENGEVVVLPSPTPNAGGAPSARPRVSATPPERLSAYEQVARRVMPQVDQLVSHLQEVLRPRRRLRRRSGYSTGYEVDVRRVMAWEADPRLYDALWRRKSIPDRREAVFSLLVDLSGSMVGPAAEHAQLGTILMAETLERMGVRYAIDGFQDVLIPIARFGDGLSPPVRAALANMHLEPAGSRPTGHNVPAFNDDGPCLLEAAAALIEQPATDRILVVVSDGEPAGARSDEADLRAAVGQLERRRAELSLVGIGLGPGTDHVTRYYRDAVANVPLSDFAVEIAAVIERVLVGAAAPPGG